MASPFLALGSAFLIGAAWITVGRLIESFEWRDHDGALVAMTILLLAFGGGLTQFGLNALHKGHSEESTSLITPFTLVILGLFLAIPGLIGSFNGSFKGFVVLIAGVTVLAISVVRVKKRGDDQ